jgi:CRP-like cAMP-binding protein
MMQTNEMGQKNWDICPMILTNKEILNWVTNEYLIDKERIDIVEFGANEIIINQGKFIKQIYVIKEGVSKCHINEENDKNFIVEFLGLGEIIGEVEAILNEKSVCSVTALSKVVLYKIELNYFKNLMQSNNEFNSLILMEMAKRIQQTAKRSSSQQLNTLEFSLLKILNLFKAQEITLCKNDLAEYLGITIRSLNRCLSKLKVDIKKL